MTPNDMQLCGRFRDVEWTPVSLRGANMDQYRFVKLSDDLVQFRPTCAAVMSYIGFVVMGIALGAAVVVQSGFHLAGKAVAGLCCSLLFSAAGLYLLARDARPVFFDRARGTWGRGLAKTGCGESLSNISALQLLEKRIRTKSRHTFPNVELNLVLDDNRRITLANFRERKAAYDQATALAAFLDRELLVAPELALAFRGRTTSCPDPAHSEPNRESDEIPHE